MKSIKANVELSMKISIVIPNYNDVRIVRSLTSIEAQTYKDYEIIVVDGMSSNALLTEIYKKFKIDHLIREKDQGIFDALNKGICRATGDVIYLMGADDQLSDGSVFEKVICAFQSGPDLDGVCIGCEFVSAGGRVLRKWYPRKITAQKMKMGIYPPHFSLFLKKDLYGLVGLFDVTVKEDIGTDTIWLLELALKKPHLNIKVIDDVHLKMEYGGASTGSIRRIVRAFVVVHNYAKQKRLSYWFIHSFVKSASKILQFLRIKI
jgi:glycosyltransferase involved in cell wall biosynthesis